MKTPRIIGLAGVAGVGKSAIAKAMEEAWGYETASFSDLVKDLCVNAFGVSLDPLTESKKMLRSGVELTPEQTAAAQGVRDQLWRIADALRAASPSESPIVKYAFRFADMGITPRTGAPMPPQVMLEGGEWKPKIVFDDVRRRDEIDGIRRRGGIVVYLDGPSLWGDKVSATDTDIRREDCDVTIQTDEACEFSAALRAKSRRREAEDGFARIMLKNLDFVFGFSKQVETSNGVMVEKEDTAEYSELGD